MRRAKRAPPVQRASWQQVAEQASDLRHLEGLVELERREDSGDAAGEHRLAGTGRAAEQDVMPARGRDLDRPSRLLLSMNLPEVVLHRANDVVGRDAGEWLGRNWREASQVRHDLGERPAWHHLQARNERGLARIHRWDKGALDAKLAKTSRRDEHSIDVPHRTVECELTEKCAARGRAAA
jgi:hypothetical protein